MLKVYNYDITFQEVPEETSLILNISNCPYHCPDCHSKFLWEDIGESINIVLEDLLNKYKTLITCVCFMGGNQEPQCLIQSLTTVQKYNIKTCLYSGCDNLEELTIFFPYLDYLKYGSYKKDLGGLNCTTTNQHFLVKLDNQWQDCTYKFQKRKNL